MDGYRFRGTEHLHRSRRLSRFNPFSSDIPDLGVNDVALDNEGGILTMAATGLVRFDGSNWVIWDTENNAIPTNYLNSVWWMMPTASGSPQKMPDYWCWTECSSGGCLSSAENTEIYPNQPMMSCSCIRPMVHRLTGNYITTGMLCRSGMTRQNTTQILLNDLSRLIPHPCIPSGGNLRTSYLIIK